MKLNLNKPIVFFDTETTGINAGQDKIIEICLLKIMPDGQKQVREYRINPERPIPPETSKVHGIYDKDVADKPKFKELAHDINNFIENSDLAGYNSNKFDIPLLVEEFYKAGIEFDIKNRRFIDVMNIFHKMEPRTLSGAYKFYCNKELTNAHNAMADTEATYEVLMAQLERYEGVEYVDKNGSTTKPIVNDIKQLHDFCKNNRWVDLVGHIAYNDKMQECFNFGKHKGKTVEEVFQKEPSYYSWIMNADFPQSTKKILTEIKLRSFNK